MNRFFSHLIAVLFLLSGALCNLQAKLDDKLPEPPYREILDNPDCPVTKLAKLLKEGKVKQFYEDVNQMFERINITWDDKPTEESFKSELWLVYLLASAPMLTVDADREWIYDKANLDYTVKWMSLQLIYHHDVDKLTKQFGISRRELTKLLASYAARVMKGFHDDYDPYFKEKDRALRKKRWEEKKTDDEQAFNNRQIGLSSRSNTAGHRLRFQERGFVRHLLEYFPGNANEIRKYAIQAGYKEDELAELFELTVGHSKETEFLYKGIPKAKRDRKKEDVRRDIAL